MANQRYPCDTAPSRCRGPQSRPAGNRTKAYLKTPRTSRRVAWPAMTMTVAIDGGSIDAERGRWPVGPRYGLRAGHLAPGPAGPKIDRLQTVLDLATPGLIGQHDHMPGACHRMCHPVQHRPTRQAGIFRVQAGLNLIWRDDQAGAFRMRVPGKPRYKPRSLYGIANRLMPGVSLYAPWS